MSVHSENTNFHARERFVDADVAADFLSIDRRYLLDLARAGVIPATRLGMGKRGVWRFRLREIEKSLCRSGFGFTSGERSVITREGSPRVAKGSGDGD